MIERKQTRLEDATVYYQVVGSGEPLVLIHGLSGSYRWWDKNLDAFARHFRVYAINLAHFGEGRNRSRFALRDAARQVVGWMDKVGLARASFVGHSMGGLIVAELAVDYPERVERLVLVDAAVPPLHPGHLHTGLGLFRALFVLPFDFLPVLLVDAIRAGVQTIIRAAREMLASDIGSRITGVQAPTLLVWGERDALVPPRIGRQIQKSLPNARLIIIKGAGHNPMWDRPDEYNRVVLEFLRASDNPVR